MKLSIQNNKLKIELSLFEKILSVKPSDIEIDFRDIVNVSTEKPKFTWKMIRCPGTGLPGVLMAGNFYIRENGKWSKEFWYWRFKDNALVLKLKRSENNKYDRIVLSIEHNEHWKEVVKSQINF